MEAHTRDAMPNRSQSGVPGLIGECIPTRNLAITKLPTRPRLITLCGESVGRAGLGGPSSLENVSGPISITEQVDLQVRYVHG
jgi:hypothetical protein